MQGKKRLIVQARGAAVIGLLKPLEQGRYEGLGFA